MIDTTKIIHAPVGGGRYTVTSPIVKEDYGLYLKIEGLELPSTYEVDFSNDEHSGTSVTMIGNADGALIPRQFISSGKDVFAFLYHVGVDFGRTVYKFRIPNKLRPDRTNEQPTPEEQSTIDQTINALNEAVDKTAQDVIDADEAASDASQAATNAALARNAAQSAETNARTYALNAGTKAVESAQSATASAESASQAQTSARTATEKADSILNLTASAQTLPEGSSASASYDAQTGVMTFGIPKGDKGDKGDTGAQGIQGEQGERGLTGQDGISPTVTITPITGGHRITITDADGEHSADVMDGTGSVDDVQINGTSIVADGVANVPVGSNSQVGVLKTNILYGITSSNGELRVYSANESEIKSGSNDYRPIAPKRVHASAFYGLAKASGDTTQSQSSNAVGVYTESAKSAISEMLNGSVSVSGTTPTIVAKAGIRYVCGEVSTLDITLPQSGIVDVVFESGSTATVLTITGTVKWANGFDPTALDANTTYELNIMDGLGVAVGWT